MTPSRPAILLALFVSAAAVAWGVLRVAESRGNVLPPLPWTAPLGVGGLALVVLVSAVALRRRLKGWAGARPVRPLGVARMAVLGKASAHVGPLIGGFYAGHLLLLAPTIDVEARRDRAVVALLSIIAAAGLTAAGLFLERVCRVRPGSDVDQPPPAASGP
ncbi:MAG: DUF3180 domain-containing protein [Actinomycetes bacterium]